MPYKGSSTVTHLEVSWRSVDRLLRNMDCYRNNPHARSPKGNHQTNLEGGPGNVLIFCLLSEFKLNSESCYLVTNISSLQSLYLNV